MLQASWWRNGPQEKLHTQKLGNQTHFIKKLSPTLVWLSLLITENGMNFIRFSCSFVSGESEQPPATSTRNSDPMLLNNCIVAAARGTAVAAAGDSHGRGGHCGRTVRPETGEQVVPVNYSCDLCFGPTRLCEYPHAQA